MKMEKAMVAISSDFLTAFAALPRKTQTKVTDFINKFRSNPKAPGINYEKIQGALDNKICSVRIDETYRGIVARQAETGVYILLWVDHHDEAYAWAARKRCDVNKETGNVQVYDVQTETVSDDGSAGKLFSMISDDGLKKIGVPAEQIPFVRSISDEASFYKAKASIPSDAYEGLEWLANGFPLDEVLEVCSVPDIKDVDTDDLANALRTDRSQSSFLVLEGEDELKRIMAEPLEKWRVFLHPTQRKLIERDYSGACRILGGAGTGKTVVAMHRAKWLASQLDNRGRILFTTFTANLASDIKENLRKICSLEELRRIEVIHLDAWVSQYLRENDFSYSVVYDETTDSLWSEAISRSGENLDLPPSFFPDEWSKVVATQEAFTKEKYLQASRIGRGTRLDRKARSQVWNVFEEYLALMKEHQVRDVDTAMYECRVILDKDSTQSYSSIIVDEGQDFGANAYKLLRKMAGEERRNDIFIVGDAHQRIYKKKAVLSKSGINIRGRSSNLRINYRTTEEIRKYAFAVLQDIPFDNLDGEYEAETLCQSLTHGDYPQIVNFKTANEEYGYIAKEIKALADDGVQLSNICLVARTNNILDDYKRELQNAGIKVYEIKRKKPDDRSFDGVRIATMHRVKGLEFPYIFIVAANNRVIPLASAMADSDPVSKGESLTAEKCLFYVALTRAQKAAYITSYGNKSEFLVNSQ
jgi:superfamily I DNA/RNA helicase